MHLNVLPNTTCFAVTAEHGVPCRRKSCRESIISESNLNCAVLAARRAPLTLKECAAAMGYRSRSSVEDIIEKTLAKLGAVTRRKRTMAKMGVK